MEKCGGGISLYYMYLARIRIGARARETFATPIKRGKGRNSHSFRRHFLFKFGIILVKHRRPCVLVRVLAYAKRERCEALFRNAIRRECKWEARIGYLSPLTGAGKCNFAEDLIDYRRRKVSRESDTSSRMQAKLTKTGSAKHGSAWTVKNNVEEVITK